MNNFYTLLLMIFICSSCATSRPGYYRSQASKKATPWGALHSHENSQWSWFYKVEDTDRSDLVLTVFIRNNSPNELTFKKDMISLLRSGQRVKAFAKESLLHHREVTLKNTRQRVDRNDSLEAINIGLDLLHLVAGNVEEFDESVDEQRQREIERLANRQEVVLALRRRNLIKSMYLEDSINVAPGQVYNFFVRFRLKRKKGHPPLILSFNDEKADTLSFVRI